MDEHNQFRYEIEINKKKKLNREKEFETEQNNNSILNQNFELIVIYFIKRAKEKLLDNYRSSI